MRQGNGASEAVRVPRVEATPRAVTLEVPAIRLEVRLGCEAAERALPQAVDIELRIRFADLPAACWTDELADTVCYAELAALLREHCAQREFRLIERLALELSGVVRALPAGRGAPDAQRRQARSAGARAGARRALHDRRSLSGENDHGCPPRAARAERSRGRPRHRRRGGAAAARRRADPVGELHLPGGAGGARHGADQQVRRGLSRPPLLRRAGVHRRDRDAGARARVRACSAPSTPTCSRCRARR